MMYCFCGTIELQSKKNRQSVVADLPVCEISCIGYTLSHDLSNRLMGYSLLSVPDTQNGIKVNTRHCPNPDNLDRDTHVVDCTLYSALSDSLKNTGGEKSIKCLPEDAVAGSGNTRELSTVELMLYPLVKGVVGISRGKGFAIN